MAIDDNASYELTGYQVKDLAQKIRAKADSASLASVATSGLYSDIIGAPTIPTVYNGTLTIQQNGTTIGTFSANQSTNETINITGGGATYSDFTGATSSSAGAHGLVPAPAAGDDTKYLKGDGTWGTISQYTPTVFYVDKELPYFGRTPFVTDVSVYKDSALTETATLQELYDAMDAGNTALVYDAAMNGAKVYTTLYAFHAPHGGNPDSNGDYLYFAGDDGTVISANPQGFSTNDAAVFNTGVYGLYSVNVMGGATSSVTGAAGLVPAPAAGDQEKVLLGNGTWGNATAKLVEMSYGESNAWAKFIAAYNAGSIVYCRASSNSNPATGSQTRKAFMAYVNNAANPTEVEFQYVRSVSSKTDSQQGDQVFVYKLTNASGGTWTVTTRNMSTKIVTGTGMTSTFTTGADGTITLNAEPNYSTSEVDTKVKWVDGKTIYRKTIDCGALPNATSKRVSIGASGVSRYVKFEGVAFTSNNTTISLPYVNHGNASYQVDVYIDSGDLVISAGNDKSVYANSYITVYYTKS